MGGEAKSSWHAVNSCKSNSKEGPRSKEDRMGTKSKRNKGKTTVRRSRGRDGGKFLQAVVIYRGTHTCHTIHLTRKGYVFLEEVIPGVHAV